jgi:hypothetical protein
MQRIQHLFLLPGLMAGTFFSQHIVITFVSSFKGDTTKGGPILVAYGDLFTVFLITIRLVLKRQGR